MVLFCLQSLVSRNCSLSVLCHWLMSPGGGWWPLTGPVSSLRTQLCPLCQPRIGQWSVILSSYWLIQCPLRSHACAVTTHNQQPHSATKSPGQWSLCNDLKLNCNLKYTAHTHKPQQVLPANKNTAFSPSLLCLHAWLWNNADSNSVNCWLQQIKQ